MELTQSGLQTIRREFAGRRALISAELWKWNRDNIKQFMGRKFDADPDFLLPSVKPIAKRTKEQAEEICERITDLCHFEEQRHPILEKIDGAYMRVLMEIVYANTLDFPVFFVRLCSTQRYLDLRGSVEKVIEAIDARIDTAYTGEISDIAYRILNDFWEQERKYHKADIHWHKGTPYDNENEWREAISKNLEEAK